MNRVRALVQAAIVMAVGTAIAAWLGWLVLVFGWVSSR